MSNDNIYTKFGCSLFASMCCNNHCSPIRCDEKYPSKFNYKVYISISADYTKDISTGLMRQVTYSAPNIVLYSRVVKQI